MSSRFIAARALCLVLDQGKALDVALLTAMDTFKIEARDRAYAQALCFAALRHGFAYQVVISALVPKPPAPAVMALLMIGFADIAVLETAPFAAVNEAVSAARQLGLPYATGLVNAVMRRFARDHQHLLAAACDKSAQARSGLPSWLEAALQSAYPSQIAGLIAALKVPAPMWLRVGNTVSNAETYWQRFDDELADTVQLFSRLPQALVMQSTPVSELPGFGEGEVSVQDGAAQLAALLIAPQAGECILDACAAPGGKTAHLLELAPDAKIVAVDSDAMRLKRVQETLDRIGRRCELIAGDAGALAEFSAAGTPLSAFDAILLDAPCTATGVLRRHPDIAWLRRATDVRQTCAQQRRLLDALWPRVKRGGRMLYVTCSVLPEENGAQIAAFLARTPDAEISPFPQAYGWFGFAVNAAGQYLGQQNLPGQNGMDGFFYALVRKR
jgi:16S rRNA (cytosine967-C5)-methyltransferase